MRVHRSQLDRHTAPRGFTLLELVLVMLLISAMLAVAVPSLRGFLGGTRARDTVTQIVSLAQFAKARSAAEAKIYRLNVEANTYWLTAQQDGGPEFVELGSDFGRRFELPANVRLEVVPPPAGVGTFAPGTVTFYPDGRTNTGLFRLTDEAERVTLLGCPSPSESFRVVTPEEAERL